MARFEKIRSDAIKEMSKADFKAFELDEKSEHIKERAEKLQEGISRIPHDLPEELQQQIDAVCQKAQSDVRERQNPWLKMCMKRKLMQIKRLIEPAKIVMI